ncbi:hypothetical protein D3C87_1443130 [compost metagenome]
MQPFCSGDQQETEAEAIGCMQPVTTEISIFDEARGSEPDREESCNPRPELGEIRIVGALAFQEGKTAEQKNGAKTKRHGDFSHVAGLHRRQRNRGIVDDADEIEPGARHHRDRSLRAKCCDNGGPDRVAAGSTKGSQPCDER